MQAGLALGTQALHAPEEPVAHALVERQRGEEGANRAEVPEPQGAVGQAERFQAGEGEVDHLGVGGGPGRAEQLDAGLGVLAGAAGLGLLVAEDGAAVGEAQRQGLALHPGDVGADDRGGELGAQGDLAVAVVEGVHLRGALLARLAQEELGRLDHGGVDHAVAVRREVPLQPRGDLHAEGALGGRHVGHPAHPLDRPLLPLLPLLPATVAAHHTLRIRAGLWVRPMAVTSMKKPTACCAVGIRPALALAPLLSPRRAPARRPTPPGGRGADDGAGGRRAHEARGGPWG